MNTFIINLNDTTALSDSIVTKVIKLSEACQPVVTEAETNCNDVMIVAFISVAIVLVALIAKWAVWSWKEAELMGAKNERGAKEKEDDIAERKKKADALNKLVDYLEKNTVQERYDAEEGKRIKEEKGIGSEEGEYYIDVLRAVIKGEVIPELPLKKQGDEKKNP